MNHYTCGNCLFGEDCGSQDMVWCEIKKTHLKINDPGCARHKYQPPEKRPQPCAKCKGTGWVLVERDGKETAQRCSCLKRRIVKQKKEESDNGSKIYS